MGVGSLCLLGSGLVLGACTGVLGGGDQGEGGGEVPLPEEPSRSEDNPDIAPTEFDCNPELVAPTPGIRRLTRRQYENTLRDLLTTALGEADVATSLLDEAASYLEMIPADERAIVPQDLHGSFRRLDQSVQQSHVDGYYETGLELGRLVTQQAHLPQLLGECATDADADNDDQCLTDFVRKFGALALRRPLEDEEVDFYRGFYEPSTGIDPAGFADVVAGLLNAPQFLYIVEHGEEEGEPADTFQLAAYELAARLSYHFWDTMPDERLFELAASGEILEDSTYLAEVERMWADDRTRSTLQSFFLEWMKLEEVADLDQNNDAPIFRAFAGDDLPSADLRAAMIDEVLDLFDYFTWEQPGGIEQIFTTRYSFARSDELASLYDVPAWDGEGEPPTIEQERPGLLTRGAFLSTGTANTRPVMKGLFIRRTILCDVIPPPPENAMAIPPDLSPTLSTREVVEALTEAKGTGCANCHSIYMNPLGFATENFDGLGRHRTSQTLFDDEGSVLGDAAIDTTSIPRVILDDDTPSEGPSDLMGLIADSGKASACAVRHYFRFSFGRFEGVISDGCALEQMRIALEETGSLAGMLREVALTDAFRRKTFRFEEGGE